MRFGTVRPDPGHQNELGRENPWLSITLWQSIRQLRQRPNWQSSVAKLARYLDAMPYARTEAIKTYAEANRPLTPKGRFVIHDLVLREGDVVYPAPGRGTPILERGDLGWGGVRNGP
jgi:hypothetical protein